MGEIIQSMFGPTPYQIQQANIDRANKDAIAYGQMDPYAAMRAGQYKLGGQLGSMLGSAIGMEEPAVVEAQQSEAIQKQIDHSTPEGLLKGAQLFNQAGNPKMAYMYTQAAQARQAEMSKIAKDSAQTRLAEVQATELPQMRHEEAMARLAQSAEAAKMRSEDMRLSIQQRADAARESNTIRLEIARLAASGKNVGPGGVKLTKGQEAADKEFGKSYADYQAAGGSADVEKQLQQLQQVSDSLGGEGNNFTGPVVGMIPDFARSFTNPEAIAAKNKVDEVVQRNLRLVLGAQFTEKEGERLIARAYNPQLSSKENKRRVDSLIRQIKTAAQTKEDAARYFEENGTLSGWKGRMPTLSDFEESLNLSTDKEKPKPDGLPTGSKYIGKSPEGKDVYQSPDGRKWVQ